MSAVRRFIPLFIRISPGAIAGPNVSRAPQFRELAAGQIGPNIIQSRSFSCG
jgi:hypothetical protein